MAIINANMQQKRDTTANWEAANPTPYDGEITIDTTIGKVKIGDGVTSWTGLTYVGFDGTSGTSGISGTSGTSGTSGVSGTSGSSGINGTSGSSGINGTSGSSGINGTSGSSGVNGTSGTSGTSGVSGTSGSSGINGTSGSSGVNGTSGSSGINGTSGSSGINGTSGSSGINGTSGTSGTSGISGTSGSSGINGTSGSSGINGTSGSSGINGSSGSSGTSGDDGIGNTGLSYADFWYDNTGSTVYVPNIYTNATLNNSNIINVGSNDFPTLAYTLTWLETNMTGPTSVRLSESETITSPITINYTYDLMIQSNGYGLVTLTAGAALSNQKMFSLESNCAFRMLYFDAGTATGTTTCLYSGVDDLYFEFKDAAIDSGFDIGILQESNSEWWVFEAVIDNCKTAGYRLNTTKSGARFRSAMTDYSASATYPNFIGIDLVSGSSMYISAEHNTTELTTTGQTFIQYNGSAITYTEFMIINNLWNSTGNFRKGFDFSLQRDANIEMFGNVGDEDHKPHCKLGFINTGVTTIAVQNVWYPVVLQAPVVNYLRKFVQSGATNNLTYVTEHKTDIIMFVSGNIIPNSNTNTLWEVAVIKNGITGTTYGNMRCTTDASGRAFAFSTNAYISSVIFGDYFTFMIRNTTNASVNPNVADLNAFINSM